MERNRWLTKAMKEQFHQRLQGNSKNARRNEVNFFCIEKTHQWKILRLKSTGSNEEQIWILVTLTVEEICCRQNRNIIEQFLQVSIWEDMMRAKRDIFQRKIPKSTHLCSTKFLITIVNVSVVEQKEKIAIKNLNLRFKKFIPTLTIQLKSPGKFGKLEFYHFSSIMSEKNLCNSSRICRHLRKIKLFLVFAGQKQISGTSRVTDEKVYYFASNLSFRKQLMR